MRQYTLRYRGDYPLGIHCWAVSNFFDLWILVLAFVHDQTCAWPSIYPCNCNFYPIACFCACCGPKTFPAAHYQHLGLHFEMTLTYLTSCFWDISPKNSSRLMYSPYWVLFQWCCCSALWFARTCAGVVTLWGKPFSLSLLGFELCIVGYCPNQFYN